MPTAAVPDLSAGSSDAALSTTSAAATVDVSVCIANWNCRDLLRGCLRSLRPGLQKIRLEVIVVDNASADGAADMVAHEFPDVVLVRNPTNEGFSRANNRAARRARGRYLFFLNNDTVVPPGTLRELLDFAEAHPDAGLIGPRLRGGDGAVQVSYRCRPTLATLLHRTTLLRWTGLLRGGYRRYRRDAFDPDATRDVAILMGAAILAPRERFLAWGGWDEDFAFGGEDLELSVRVGARARLVYYPAVEITHFGRVSTRQHVDFAPPQIAVGMARYLRKTGVSPAALWLYRAVVTLDAPLTIMVKSAEFVLRRLRGDTRKAQKSLLSARAAWAFLRRGSWEFWKV